VSLRTLQAPPPLPIRRRREQAMTRSGMSVAARVAAAIFGVCVVAAVAVADAQVRPGNSAALTHDFPQLQSSVQAEIGIALTPIGGSGPTLSLGPWPSGPAWSTIKVPLVMAALRAERPPPDVTAEMVAAITQSDNAAADAIWAGLGDPVTAAHQVDAVLAEAGDHTQVQSIKLQPQFSAYGQTEWPLTAQVRFLSTAACDRRNAPVLNLMGQIEQSQRWGMGAIAGTRFKGGWGPFPSGKYLVRQMGLITTPRGSSVVAAAAEPHSGLFADGVVALDHIAAWLADHIVVLPSGRCR
jgi:hypothetical protein